MSKLAVLFTALVMTTLSYAGSPTFAKNSPSLNALANAWKTKQITGTQISKPNNHMVYGGDDVSPKTTLITPTATA